MRFIAIFAVVPYPLCKSSLSLSHFCWCRFLRTFVIFMRDARRRRATPRQLPLERPPVDSKIPLTKGGFRLLKLAEVVWASKDQRNKDMRNMDKNKYLQVNTSYPCFFVCLSKFHLFSSKNGLQEAKIPASN